MSVSGGRIAGYLSLAVFGALVGIAGSLVQGAWFPAGLVLALLATTGLFYGALLLTGTQLGVLAPAIGWLLAIVALSIGRPEGDGMFGSRRGAARLHARRNGDRCDVRHPAQACATGRRPRPTWQVRAGRSTSSTVVCRSGANVPHTALTSGGTPGAHAARRAPMVGRPQGVGRH